MGLFGGDSSSSSTQLVYNTTRTLGADQGSIVANEGATVNVLDAGAVNKALDVGQKSTAAALDNARSSNELAFNFAGGTLADLNAAFNKSLDTAFQFARDTLGVSKATTEQQLATSDKALSATLGLASNVQSSGADRLLWLGGLALVAFVAVAYFNK